MCVYMNVYMCMRTYMHTHECIHWPHRAYIQVHTHTGTHLHPHSIAHACILMFILWFCFAYDYIQRNACMHPWCTRVVIHQLRSHANVYFKCRSLCVYTWMCECACAHTCTHMNACIDNIMRTCVCTRTQEHTHIHTLLRTRAYAHMRTFMGALS